MFPIFKDSSLFVEPGEVVNMKGGATDAYTLPSNYCRRLFEQNGTYEEVARRTRLDCRTVKKYLVTAVEDKYSPISIDVGACI
jgi:hypothetical protein